MPNVGKPSQDCHECRRRRVKCDLKRPGCDRCARINKQCPGYRDQTDLMFKHTHFEPSNADKDQCTQNTVTGQQSRERRRGPPKLTLPSSAELQQPDAWLSDPLLQELDRFVLEHGTSSMFEDPMAVDWNAYSIPLTLSMLSSGRGQPRVWGHFGVLPQILLRSEPNSSLRHACRALGLAYLSSRFKSAELESLRDDAYGKALLSTKHRISISALAPQDETIISIYILGMFELVVGPSAFVLKVSELHWEIHTGVQTELLRLRGPSQIDDPIGRHTFWLMTLSISIRSIMAGSDYPDVLDEMAVLFSERYPGIDQNEVVTSNFASQAAYINATLEKARWVLSYDGALPLLFSMRSKVQKLDVFAESILEVVQNPEITDPYVVLSGSRVCAYYIRTLYRMLDYILKVQETATDEAQRSELDSLFQMYKSRAQQLIDMFLDEALGLMVANGHVECNAMRLRIAPTRAYDRFLCWKDHIYTMGLLRMLNFSKNYARQDQARLVVSLLKILGERYHLAHASAPRVTR